MEVLESIPQERISEWDPKKALFTIVKVEPAARDSLAPAGSVWSHS